LLVSSHMTVESLHFADSIGGGRRSSNPFCVHFGRCRQSYLSSFGNLHFPDTRAGIRMLARSSKVCQTGNSIEFWSSWAAIGEFGGLTSLGNHLWWFKWSENSKSPWAGCSISQLMSVGADEIFIISVIS